MRLTTISPLVLATTAAAAADHWQFTAWDGLSCGGAPQNGQVFMTAEGVGEQICINFEQGQKAYSYMVRFSNEDTTVMGYRAEKCEGPGRLLKNDTCTNPDIDIPYIRSIGINRQKHGKPLDWISLRYTN